MFALQISDHILSDIVLPIAISGSLGGLFVYVAFCAWAHGILSENYPALLGVSSGAMSSNLGQGIREFYEVPPALRSGEIWRISNPLHKWFFVATRVVGWLWTLSLVLMVLDLVLMPKH
ncbi:hypothetical protein JCM19000A_06350 [Silvimonas sp. JCM 19000]